jgi:hypothetical protein
LQRILYFLVLCIGISANLLSFAGKSPFMYGGLRLEPEQEKAKMVIHLFEEDFKTEKLFTNPQVFSTSKTIERVEFESAEPLAEQGKKLLFQWGKSKEADDDLLLQGTLTLFQAAQYGSPEARRWIYNIYESFFYYYYDHNNKALAQIYNAQKCKLFSGSVEERWSEAKHKFGSGKTEPSRVIAPGVLVLQPGQQAPKVSKRLESIDGRSLSDATRQAQEDERAATEQTRLLAADSEERQPPVSCMDIPPLQSLVDAASRLVSGAHPKQE